MIDVACYRSDELPRRYILAHCSIIEEPECTNVYLFKECVSSIPKTKCIELRSRKKSELFMLRSSCADEVSLLARRLTHTIEIGEHPIVGFMLRATSHKHIERMSGSENHLFSHAKSPLRSSSLIST
jgi:hypothetical protein